MSNLARNLNTLIKLAAKVDPDEFAKKYTKKWVRRPGAIASENVKKDDKKKEDAEKVASVISMLKLRKFK